MFSSCVIILCVMASIALASNILTMVCGTESKPARFVVKITSRCSLQWRPKELSSLNKNNFKIMGTLICQNQLIHFFCIMSLRWADKISIEVSRTDIIPNDIIPTALLILTLQLIADRTLPRASLASQEPSEVALDCDRLG